MAENSYKVTPEQIAAYKEDGAIALRNVLSQEWIERMQVAIDRMMEQSNTGIEFTPEGKQGRYYGDLFVWLRDLDFRALFLESPLGNVAAQLMESSEARVFFDQLLVKEPNTEEKTPWHQDLPYWPVLGEDIISIWCGFDPVTRDSGGVVYVKGSHKWNKFYKPDAFGDNEESVARFEKFFGDIDLEPIPDIDGNPDDYEILSWDLEPGDVLIHHALTIHGSSGNFSSTRRRRGLALRYIGDDAVFDDRPGTFLNIPALKEAVGLDKFKSGEPYSGKCFPRAWPPEE